MQTNQLIQELNQLYKPEEWLGIDDSCNGLQIQPEKSEVKKVALTVDASRATFEKAVKTGAELLIVHHGLFWGNKPALLTGMMYERIRTMMGAGMGLYAMHLPMDAQPEIGHNAILADKLSLKNREVFAQVGWSGELTETITLKEVMAKLGVEERRCEVIKNSERAIRKVGIVSGGGGGTAMAVEAISKGCDLYLTGELSHSSVIFAKEGGVNMIAAGHYWTETWGLKALQKMLEEKYGLETVWIEEDTGW